LEQFIRDQATAAGDSRPVIFDLSKQDDQHVLSPLVSAQKIQRVIDDYEEQVREHFAVMNPTHALVPDFSAETSAYLARLAADAPLWQQGRWVYYPWLSTLVHVLEEKEYQQVRTARNRNLITQEEQEKFSRATVGIAGLSVGNSAALAIALQGGARYMRLADHDILALSNLNRIRAGIGSLGQRKTDMTARQIYELNPYSEPSLFPEGLTDENIERFFSGPPTLDAVVDEIDDLVIKCRIREYAKKMRIPLVSAADVADNGVIFVERYDQDNNLTPFLGYLGEVQMQDIKQMSKKEVGGVIAQLLGMEHHTARMLSSLQEIGKTVVSWPQLGGAALLNGAAVAYCVRKIVLGEPMPSGRYFLSLDHALGKVGYIS